jgi:Zn-dependent protease
MQPQTLVLGAMWYIIFLFSTTCHEGAHALAAKLGGDLTAFHSGQVTLNPIPHIRREPFGTVVVPILSYLWGGWMIGWASAPYDPIWQERYPRRAAWMALAGPGANFALVLLAGLGIRAGMMLGAFHAPMSASTTQITEAIGSSGANFAATLLSILFVLNLVLGTFNLLPVPPLDGRTGITLLMSEGRARQFLEWTQQRNFGFIGLLVAWLAFEKLFNFVFPFALNLLYPGASYH